MNLALAVRPDYDPNEPGIESFELDLKFDPEVLSFVEASEADGFTALVNDTKRDEGLIEINGFLSDPTDGPAEFDSRPLLEATFDELDSERSAEITVTGTYLDDINLPDTIVG